VPPVLAVTDGLEVVEVDEEHRGRAPRRRRHRGRHRNPGRPVRRTKRELDESESFHTGQPIEQIEPASDRWSTALEALEYGFVDHVVSRSATLPRGAGAFGGA
jgi:hypothetical protein